MVLLLKHLTRPETLLLLLWGSQVVRMAWPDPVMDLAGAGIAAAFILRVFVFLRRPTIVLCSALAAVAAVLIFLYGGPAAVLVGFKAAPMFAGFFGTIVLLRATGEQLRQIAQARALFERLEPDHRLGGFLVGSHLLAVVLGPGAYAITAPIIGRSKSEAEHLAAMRACHRGGGLAGLWSPFWIAMALSSQYVPGVPLWHTMALGMSMAACALTASHVLYAPEPSIALLWRALRSLHPIVPPVGVCVLTVAVLSGVTVLSGLEALIVSVPVLCALALLGKGRRAFVTAVANTYRGTAHVGNEIAILTISLALGGVIRHVFAQTGVTAWIGGLDLPAMAVIAIMIGGTAVGALAGVHQVVSVSLLLTVFTELPVRVAGVVLIESTLAAWSCSSIIGLSAIMVATATTMFRVPSERVILGPNLAFAALFATAAILALSGVNALLV
ncbi:MAG: hypothetical protein OXK82_07740 [Deltaproteobacteria bacterium]|nr:hypothetical protein [Deltaproteobacteria bacterium]